MELVAQRFRYKIRSKLFRDCNPQHFGNSENEVATPRYDATPTMIIYAAPRIEIVGKSHVQIGAPQKLRRAKKFKPSDSWRRIREREDFSGELRVCEKFRDSRNCYAATLERVELLVSQQV